MIQQQVSFTMCKIEFNFNNRKMIVLCGANRVGKDTVANYLVQCGYMRLAFATPLKAATSELFPADYESDAKDKTVVYDGRTARELLGAVAIGLKSQFGQDIFIDLLFAKIVDPGKTVISDCRYKNEITRIHTEYPDAQFVVIVRNDKWPDNIAFIDECGIKYSVIYNDDTIDSLYAKILHIIKIT